MIAMELRVVTIWKTHLMNPAALVKSKSHLNLYLAFFQKANAVSAAIFFIGAMGAITRIIILSAPCTFLRFDHICSR